MDNFFDHFMIQQRPSFGDEMAGTKSAQLEYGGKRVNGMVAGNEAAKGLAAV
jgi:hypothetical protein